MGRGIEDPVQDQIAGLFVELILVFASLFNLNYADKVVGPDSIGPYVVPNISHKILLIKRL